MLGWWIEQVPSWTEICEMWVPKVESEIKTNVPAQRHFVAPKSFPCLMLISSVSQLISDVLLVIVTAQVYLVAA